MNKHRAELINIAAQECRVVDLHQRYQSAVRMFARTQSPANADRIKSLFRLTRQAATDLKSMRGGMARRIIRKSFAGVAKRIAGLRGKA